MINEIKDNNLPKSKSNYWKVSFLVLLLCLLIGLGVFVCFYCQNNTLINSKKRTAEQEKLTVTPSSTAKKTSKTPKEEVTWRKTNFMGIYSFKYPNGWHVSSLWPSTCPEQSREQENTISILIDPEPINTAPRGGSFSAITIRDKSGLQNPEEVLNDSKESFKKRLQNLETEIVQTDFGKIYHYQGEIDYKKQLVETERYYFMIEGSSIENNINKHIIMTTLRIGGSHSDILREIVASFKKI